MWSEKSRWLGDRRLHRAAMLALGALAVAMLAGCDLIAPSLMPETPTNVTATDEELSDRVRVLWDEILDAREYHVWRATGPNAEFEFLEATPCPVYDDLSVVPGRTYWYRVSACNRAGCSERSASVSGSARSAKADIILAPQGLSATEGDYPDRVAVTWQASEEATHYAVYRAGAAEGPFALIAQNVYQTSYDDEAVTPGETYWYKVRACGEVTCSQLTSAVSGYAELAGPPPPNGIEATQGTEPDRVIITWDAREEADSYEIYRSDDEDGTYSLIASVEELRYEDTAVTEGQTYWYRVASCSEEDGCGPLSQPVSGWSDDDRPPPPPPSSH